MAKNADFQNRKLILVRHFNKILRAARARPLSYDRNDAALRTLRSVGRGSSRAQRVSESKDQIIFRKCFTTQYLGTILPKVKLLKEMILS